MQSFARATTGVDRRTHGLPRVRSAVLCSLVAIFAVTATVEGAAAQDAPEVTAAILAERARVLFEAGDFERSATLLEEAIATHDDPALHYNLARSLQELGRWQDSRDEYVRFLEASPDTPQRARIEARIALLDERIAEASAPPPVVPVAPPIEPTPIEPPSRGVEPAPWILTGLGAATLVVGTVFAVLFDQQVGLARSAPDHATALPHAMLAEQHAITADVLFGVGGLTLAIGFVWGIVDLVQVSSPRADAARPFTIRF